MLVIGLTGGIGVGKTTVADMFAKRGVPIIDADVLARELTQIDKPAYKAIRKHFGEEIVMADGQLDRKKLRRIIFANPKQRIWLEQLLHPLIREEIVKQIKHVSALYCLVVIPLLVENNPFPIIDRILVVDAPKPLQFDRIRNRDSHSEKEIEAILATQSVSAERLAHADDVIKNDGSLEDLVAQVDRLHQFYTALALK